MSEAASVERHAADAHEAGDVLRRIPDSRVIEAIAAAAQRLGDAAHPLGAVARAVLPERSGLSPEGVEEALRGTLSALTDSSLEAGALALPRVAPGRRAVPVGLAAMVLSSNVFTAALRPLAWSLLCRVPALVRPSARDEGLVALFVEALREADEEVAGAVRIARFERDDRAALAKLGELACVVHAWGGDEAMQQIRAALPGKVAFVGHGHGLGVALVPSACAQSVVSVAEAIALDVARYDQRGCLSPQLVLVEREGSVSGLELASALGDALAGLERTLPRGPLPIDVAASQAQWRGVAMVRGELFEGSSYGVSFEGDEAPRSTPCHRNLAVHEVADRAEALALLRSYGAHLKALGVAGDASARQTLAAQLPSPLAPRVSAVGAMQTPGLLASVDGDPPWVGALRWLDCD